MNKVNLLLRILDSKLGRSIVGNIKDETFYTLILQILSYLHVKDDLIKMVIQILQEAKGDKTWGALCTDPEVISFIRELLIEFNKNDTVLEEHQNIERI